MELQKKYEKLALKHKLPFYKEINKELEIQTIDEEEFITLLYLQHKN